MSKIADRRACRPPKRELVTVYPKGTRWPWLPRVQGSRTTADPIDETSITMKVTSRRRIGLSEWYRIRRPFAMLPLCDWLDENVYEREWPQGSYRHRFVRWSAQHLWPHLIRGWSEFF